MGKKTDELLEEVLKNYRDDRKELVVLRSKLMSIVEDDVILDAGGLVGISESVVKLSDVLSRMNAQAIEMTKVNMKHESLDPDNTIDSPRDKENIFDEIESKKEDESVN